MQVKGLPEALQQPNSGVVSNYSPTTVTKTWECLQGFSGGHALFTFPPLPIKCPGAPQKIMYLADDHFRRVSRKVLIVRTVVANYIEIFTLTYPCTAVFTCIITTMQQLEIILFQII